MRSPWKAFTAVGGSWLIVALGQPAWLFWACPLAASVGFALFWRVVLEIPFSKKRFALGTLWFAATQLIQLSWMTSTEFQGNYTFILYLGLSLFLGLQFGAITLFIDRIPLVATAAIWTLVEWGRLHLMFCGFSWNPVGLSLAANSFSLQAASLFGIFGLSFLVFLTNLSFWRGHKIIGLALALFPYLFGAVQTALYAPKIDRSPTMTVGMIQTGLLPSEKTVIENRFHEFIRPYEQWRHILTLIKECKEPLDLLVLPEYVVPSAENDPSYSYDKVCEIFKETLGVSTASLLPNSSDISNRFWLRSLGKVLKTDIVAGLEEQEGGLFFNSAFFYPHQGNQFNRYDKQVLVPLGEYLPFKWMRHLAKNYGISSFFTSGKKSKIFESKVPLTASICYEETFPHLMRKGRLKGASLFVNLTNDGWYAHSRLPQQHFDHARVRTVENGIPMVRACNTGVTAALDSLGRVIGKISDEQQAAVLVAKVPLYQYFTLYRFWGDWGIVSLSLLFLCICFFRLIPK